MQTAKIVALLLFSCKRASTAVALSRLISAVMLPLEELGAMNFWLAFQNVKIVQGSVTPLNPAPADLGCKKRLEQYDNPTLKRSCGSFLSV